MGQARRRVNDSGRNVHEHASVKLAKSLLMNMQQRAAYRTTTLRVKFFDNILASEETSKTIFSYGLLVSYLSSWHHVTTVNLLRQRWSWGDCVTCHKNLIDLTSFPSNEHSLDYIVLDEPPSMMIWVCIFTPVCIFIVTLPYKFRNFLHTVSIRANFINFCLEIILLTWYTLDVP